MLVNDLKGKKIKSYDELLSEVNILISKNEYSKDELEHCIDWLVKSMISMEKTHKKLKYDFDILQASTANIKEAYEANLKNNQKLSNEAKGFAYTIWRYDKKKKVMNEIIDKIRNYPFPIFSKMKKEIKDLISYMDSNFQNYDKLTEIDLDKIDEKIAEYMKRPVLFDAKRISKEEFEKMVSKG